MVSDGEGTIEVGYEQHRSQALKFRRVFNFSTMNALSLHHNSSPRYESRRSTTRQDYQS